MSKRKQNKKHHGKSTPKIFILDTSVLVHDPNCIEKFEENKIVIPIYAIEELDNLKKLENGRGKSARDALRKIDEISQKKNSTLLIDCQPSDFSELKDLEKSNDNKIVAVALSWKKRSSNSNVILVSKDKSMRIKATGYGLPAEDYESDKIINKIDELYNGFIVFELSPEKILEIINISYNEKQLLLKDYSNILDFSRMNRNQCVIFRSTTDEKFALGIYKPDDGIIKLILKPKDYKKMLDKNKNRVIPQNIEQCFAYSLLSDPSISLVTLAGKAGTGKTLLTMLSAYEQLENPFEKIEVYRPNIDIGKPLGFLPGGIDDKFLPWMKPIFDNLELVRKSVGSDKDKNNDKGNQFASDFAKDMMHTGILSINPINYIRGRTIHNSFIIVDEAQNLTPHEARTIVTRVGEGSKMVLNGDLFQIDNQYVDATSNALTHVIENLKGNGIFGHITLTQSKRSDLAELATLFL